MSALIFVYQILALVVALYTATALIGDHPNDKLITLRRFKNLWNSRNTFGRIQIVTVVILFVPGVIGGVLFDLVIVAVVSIVTIFVELGRKK